MQGFEAVIEQRIAEAARRGEFDNLPGCGRPLVLDDDRLIPEELRVAYRILKNAGYVPPEVETLREIAELEHLVQRASGEARDGALKKLRLLTMRLESRGSNLELEAAYYNRFVSKLGG